MREGALAELKYNISALVCLYFFESYYYQNWDYINYHIQRIQDLIATLSKQKMTYIND